MKGKPINRPQKELEIVPTLKKEISDLKVAIEKKEKIILKYDTSVLTLKNQKVKAEHRFVILQAKHDVLQAKYDKLIEPPKSHIDLSEYHNK